MSRILDAKWELFVKVADAGSVSGAAQALDMPQSVVSRSIAKLEQESGTRLFRRTGRGVVLTEAGEQIYPRICRLVEEAEEIAQHIRSGVETPAGDVRLGLLPSSVPVLAGSLFTSVRRAWPQVRLHLTEGSSALLQDLVERGRVDMALLLREEEDEPSDVNVLARLQLSLILPVEHPLAARDSIDFEELAGMPLVLPSEPHPLRARLQRITRLKGIEFGDVLEADSIRLQHELVACGGVFAITAGTLTAPESRKLVAVRIANPSLSRAIVLEISRHRPATRATWEVSRLIRTMAPHLLKQGPHG